MESKGFGRWGWMLPIIALVVLFVGVVSAHAWDINGTVTNNDATRTGRVYLYLQQQSGGDTGLGISIPTPAPNTLFKIRGVPNGSYYLKAFVDGSGTGRLHANDSTWDSPGTIEINDGNYTVNSNTTVSFTTHTTIAPVAPTGAQIIPGDNGAFVGWQKGNNGNDNADAYRVYYSTTNPDPKAGGVYTNVPAGDQDFALFRVPNSQTIYVQVTALVGSTESAATTMVSKQINPTAPGFSITGTISLSGFTPPATANLYVALVDPAGQGGPVAVAWVTSSPQPSNPFIITTNATKVPNGTYSLIALIDMNDDKRIGSGDVMADEQQAPTLTIAGFTPPSQPVILTKSNSSTYLSTSHYQDSSTPSNESYNVIIDTQARSEVLANVTITGGPSTNGLSYPIDLGPNSWGQLQTWLNLNNNRPLLTDTYNLSIQYANDTIPIDTLTLPVTAVLDSFATPTGPVGYLSYSLITDPSVYSWTPPLSPPTPYTYSFWVSANGFNNNNDMYSNLSNSTTFLSIPGLSYNDGQRYDWNINVQDSYGNQAQKSAWFIYTSTPAITSFTPTIALVGTTVTINGMNFNQSAANNQVNFNCGGSAVAQSVTPDGKQLTVVIPPTNACSGSLQVTDTSNNKTSQSSNTQLNIPYLTTIYGHVSNFITSNSIPNATVTVNWALPGNSTLTNNYGDFNLFGVPAGMDFMLIFTGTGYEPTYTGPFNTYGASNYNTSLFPTGTFTAWNSGNLTTGVIRGRVYNPSNNSDISGVTISASAGTVMYDDGTGNTPAAGSATGANGIFYIKFVPDSTTVTINATKAGYLINPVTAVGHALSITSVDVPGSPLISVSGTIVSTSNAPMEGATVEQLGTSNITNSTADGTFTISNLPGGNNFELKISSVPTYVPVYTGWINSPSSLTLPYPYILFTPTEFDTVLGITSGKGAIIGRVINSNNPATAISGATVTANGMSPSYTIRYYNSATGLFSSTTSTDSSGLFLVKDVEDGDNISVNAVAGPLINGFTIITTHANAVSEIALPCYVPPVQWGNLQFPGSMTVTASQTTPSVFGQVYMNGVTTGAPGPATGLVAEIGYGPVGSVPSDPSWIWTPAAYNSSYVWTATPGNHEFVTTLSVATPGSYDYAFRYSYFGGSYVYGDLDGSFNGYSSAQAGKLTVLPPVEAISGQVTDSLTVGIPGVQISVYNSSTGLLITSATTNSSGNYTVYDLPTGSYKLQYFKSGYATQWYINRTSQGAANPVSVTSPTVTALSRVTMQVLSVSGTVYTTAGSPVVGATVTVSGYPALTATTATDGSYTISYIPTSQNFQVMANKAGYVPAYSIMLNTTSTNALAREMILFTSTELNGGITPTTGGIFGQTMVSGLGSFLDGATVSIVSPIGKYTVLYDDGTGAGNYLPGGPTSTNGRFFIPNIADGETVVLSASRPGWSPTSQKTYVVHANAVSQGNLAGIYSTMTTVSLPIGGINPSFYGDPAAFTATVSPSTASGTVQFKVDGVNAGSPVPLASGSATSAAISSTSMTLGVHTVTAVYNGGPGHAVSTSAGLSQTVVDRIQIGNGLHYLTLLDALNASIDKGVLRLRDTRFAEDLLVNINSTFTITMMGGLNNDFLTPAAKTTSLRTLKIKQGKIIANRLVVKPD